MKRTYAYLLSDETNPPKLWAVYPDPADNQKVIFYDPQDRSNWGWTTPDNVWEVCTF